MSPNFAQRKKKWVLGSGVTYKLQIEPLYQNVLKSMFIE